MRVVALVVLVGLAGAWSYAQSGGADPAQPPRSYEERSGSFFGRRQHRNSRLPRPASSDCRRSPTPRASGGRPDATGGDGSGSASPRRLRG